MMVQKSLTNENVNCIKLNLKHDLKLIDYNSYYYIFQCTKCKAEKEISEFDYNKPIRD